MADHKVSVAIALLILNLLGFQQVHCQGRVFRTGSELREFEQFTLRERFDTAFLLPEPAIIEITGANQAATVQEDVSLNLDCLPWLRRFPGGSIQWSETQLDEFGVPGPTSTPLNPGVTPGGRITVGGPFNRWLNISAVRLVMGAEDPDSKIFMCEVCIARGSPFEECHTANYTNLVVGGPPRVSGADQPCLPGLVTPGVNGGILEAVNLPCMVSLDAPQPVPPPNVTWFRNDVVAGTGQSGMSLDPDPGFLMQFPILIMGVFDVDPFAFLRENNMVFSTSSFTNITSPMLGGLPADITLAEARAQLFNIMLGNWECVVNNDLGTSSIQYNIRMCGDSPVIPDCAVTTGNSVNFPDDGAVLPPGCDICLQPGTSATLDCTVSAGTPPIAYNWTLNGTEVSQNARLVVREPGNYSCQASNLDNAPVVEASVLFFSPRAMITSRIEGRNTDGCDRLMVDTEAERTAIRQQFDTCIYFGETLVVECTSTDPTAVLALMGGDGTMYPNGTARIEEISMANFDAANTTFSCVITNAQGPCGQFMFQSSVVVYDPATIDRLVMFGVGNENHIGAGRPEDVVVPVGPSVTLRCPTSGITQETTEWRRVIEDSTGCFIEQPIDATTSGFTLSSGMVDSLNDLILTISNFNASFEGTYVCRTQNIAGADADVVSLVTSLGTPVWQTTGFSTCSMMCQDGVRTRSVTCRNNRNMLLLPDFMCDAVSRPVSSLQCNDLFPLPCFSDPIWVPYPWSRCSLDCRGVRTREVLCQIPKTGAVRPEYECGHLQKPRTSEVCEDKCCVTDVYPSICNMLGSSHCGTLVVQKLCCWTCGLTVIP